MKIYKTNLLAICGMALVLGACSNDEQPFDTGAADGREVTISLTLSVDGYMQLGGRADEGGAFEPDQVREPRQMLSQRSQQSVNDVRIFVFGCDTANGDFLYEGGGSEPDGSYLVTSEGVFDNYTPWVGDGNETHNYELKPRLKDGRYYKFLAVGRDDKYAPQITPEKWESVYPWWFGHKTVKDCEFVVGQTRFEDATIEVCRNTSKGDLYEPNYVTEIFSGYLSTADGSPKSLYVAPEITNFVGTIYLNRAVAGIYARITNIPSHVTDDETGLEFKPDEVNLLLSVCATKTNLVTQTDASEEHFHDVIVGQVDFRYTTAFNPNPWYDNGKIFVREGAQFKDMEIPANTTVMSNFIMPVELQADDDKYEATLIIEYYTSLNNGHLIRSQKLNCSIVAVWDIENGSEGAVETAKDGNFKIEANKLYVLCEDYDINKPIDLSKVTRFDPNYVPEDSKPETIKN